MVRDRGTRSCAVRSSLAGAAVLVTAIAVAACGSGAGSGSGTSKPSAANASSNPQTLLKQTFSSAHTVKSGVLQFSIVVTPTGSSSVTGPVSLTLSGPFQSRGAHQTPESAFTVSLSGLHRQASFGVISTATGAYIRLKGVAYQLPAADFKKLQAGIAGNTSAGSAPGLSSLGIDPERWLTSPTIVGTETVDGARTEHVRAGIDLAALVPDLNRLLAKESATAARAGVPARISAATARRLAATIRNPTVDVWTGERDTTLRRLTLSATAPVTGTVSSELGGMTSAAVRMTINYSQLNQSQTIATPARVRSYAELRTKLEALGEGLEGELGGTVGSTGTAAGSGSGLAGSGAGAAGQISRYARCINRSGDDVSKMQRCKDLLGSGGQ